MSVRIDNESHCLIFPSIHCDNVNVPDNIYSSMIIPTFDEYKSYVDNYEKYYSIDDRRVFIIDSLIRTPCRLDYEEVRDLCPNLIFDDDTDTISDTISDNDVDRVYNVITEQYYTLENYIQRPQLLDNFMIDNPDYQTIFLLEFKKLFYGLKNMFDQHKCHFKITPKNITFNPNTKKMKFIDFGNFEERDEVVEFFANGENTRRNMFALKKYRPFSCFFMNYGSYKYFKNLKDNEMNSFTHFIDNVFSNQREAFVDKNPKLQYLKKQLVYNNDETNNEFQEYKQFIRTKHNTFEIILEEMKKKYFNRSMSREDFLENVIQEVDIYGLTQTIIEFIQIIPLEETITRRILPFLENIVNETNSSNLSYNITKIIKVYDGIIENLVPQVPSAPPIIVPPRTSSTRRTRPPIVVPPRTSSTRRNRPPIVVPPRKTSAKSISYDDGRQYILKLTDMKAYDEPISTNYINYNYKIMRVFTKKNIFVQLNKLSPKNYTTIHNFMISNPKKKYILIDKDAYHKIKYNLYCDDTEEINPLTKKCVDKCESGKYRYLKNNTFTCKKRDGKDKEK